jgi:uncharacterized membrane protein YkvA (DUF1232 family)
MKLNAPFAFLLTLVRNPKTRWWAIGFVLIYILSPIDLIPEFLIPLLGLLDDGGLFIGLVWALLGVRQKVRTYNPNKKI